MRLGEADAQPKPQEKRVSVMPKKSTSEADKAGGTIGELIKQKLGAKLAINKEDEEKAEAEKPAAAEHEEEEKKEE
jgi:hypothetical protein